MTSVYGKYGYGSSQTSNNSSVINKKDFSQVQGHIVDALMDYFTKESKEGSSVQHCVNEIMDIVRCYADLGKGPFVSLHPKQAAIELCSNFSAGKTFYFPHFYKALEHLEINISTPYNQLKEYNDNLKLREGFSLPPKKKAVSNNNNNNNSLNSDSQLLQKMVNTQELTIQQLKTSVSTKDTEISSLLAQVKSLQIQLNQKNSNVANNEEQSREIEQLKEERDQARTAEKKAQQELSEVLHKHRLATDEIKELKSKPVLNSNLESENKALLNRIQSLEGEKLENLQSIQVMTNELESAKESKNLAETYRKEMISLHADIGTHLETIENLKSELASLKSNKSQAKSWFPFK